MRAYLLAPGYAAANAAMRSAVFSGVEQISAPVTIAWGDRDRLVAPPRRVPSGVRSLVLRGCGHLPTRDDPEQVADVPAVRRRLGRLELAPSELAQRLCRALAQAAVAPAL